METKQKQQAFMPGYSGIILAGGKSSRFGFNKIEIKIDKVPLFIDQVFKLSGCCSEILIITSKQNRQFIVSELKNINAYTSYYPSIKTFPGKKIRVLDDEFFLPATSPGAIKGLYTGLKNAFCAYSIVLAFDMPFTSRRLMHVLMCGSAVNTDDIIIERKPKTDKKICAGTLKETDARIIKTSKGFEVLCGLYSKNCIRALKESILKNNFRISGVFHKLNIEIIDESQLTKENIDSLNFFNINSVEDYYRFTDIWRSIGAASAGKNATNSSTGDPVKIFAEKWDSFYYR